MSGLPLATRIWRGLSQGFLYGAALGMLVGFAWQAFVTVPPSRAMSLWRDFILAGGAAGAALGAVLGPRLIRE